MICLLPFSESGAFDAISLASSTAAASSSLGAATTSLTRPICSARSASMLRPTKNSSRVRAAPTVSMNF